MISTIDSSEPPTLAGVLQHSVIIPRVRDTFNALHSLINLETSAGNDETGAGNDDSKIIVFGTTARLVALFAKLFKQTKLKSFELHSRLNQAQRTRITSEFKEAKSGIMFATDGTSTILCCYCNSCRPNNGSSHRSRHGLP